MVVHQLLSGVLHVVADLEEAHGLSRWSSARLARVVVSRSTGAKIKRRRVVLSVAFLVRAYGAN